MELMLLSRVKVVPSISLSGQQPPVMSFVKAVDIRAIGSRVRMGRIGAQQNLSFMYQQLLSFIICDSCWEINSVTEMEKLLQECHWPFSGRSNL